VAVSVNSTLVKVITLVLLYNVFGDSQTFTFFAANATNGNARSKAMINAFCFIVIFILTIYDYIYLYTMLFYEK
jgi:hypothetical protein